jgi:hypothetical protein
MSQISTHLQLPYIQPAQAQKHVTHNEAIELLDVIVQLTVQGFAADTPPATPSEGETWALGATPTGVWAGQAQQIASWRAGGWIFIAPVAGWRAYSVTDVQTRVYDGIAWVGTVSFENLPGLGVNATSDATNKLAVSAEASLFNHAGAGHQLKLNKATSGDTASLLYQTNWSGRAEMGLTGGDDFAIKVSDGSAWFTGLTVRHASGVVQVDSLLNLPPQATPATAAAGDIYFDSTSNKLRCYDGTLWQDLF